jgi:hypothetical protein
MKGWCAFVWPPGGLGSCSFWKELVMANFAGESGVRAKFQLNDSTLVPSALVVSSIDDAHVEVLRLLDPIYDVGSPDDAVVLGETMLAGAHLLRSLASDEGFRQRHLQVGGQRVGGDVRLDGLLALAQGAEERAWLTLEPFTLASASREVAAAMLSTPVLGEE